MAWEDRNGRQYYYKKRREGRRVVSVYCGSGEFAVLLAELDYLDREKERAKRRAEQQELDGWLALDRGINQVLDLCSDLAGAVLLLSGFHPHKGQWRQRRDE